VLDGLDDDAPGPSPLAGGVEGYEVTKPFWPFLWIYAAENLFGMTGMLLAPAVLFGLLALVPLADRRAGHAATVVRVAGIALFGLMVAAIIFAAVAPAADHAATDHADEAVAAAEPSADPLVLDRARSAAVTWGTMAAIGLAVVLGGVLLRRPPHGV
jgi:quinol-cytochrome oxidoreductase complex cytochrome b subunit